MNLDQAVALAEDKSARLGFAQPEGGKVVVPVRSLNDLLLANKPGNLAVADPAIPECEWVRFSVMQFANDFTFADPARRVTMVSNIRPGANCILRGFRAKGNPIGSTLVGTTKLAPGDIISIDPLKVNDVWLDGLHLVGPSMDGGIDCASSGITNATPPCRYTFTNSTIEGTNKTALVNGDAAKLDEFKVFATWSNVRMLNCKQRLPRVGYNGFWEGHRCTVEASMDPTEFSGACAVFGGAVITFCKFRGAAGRFAIRAFGDAPVEGFGNDTGGLLVDRLPDPYLTGGGDVA